MVIARYYVIGLTKEEVGEGRINLIRDFLHSRAAKTVHDTKSGLSPFPLHQEIIVASLSKRAAKNWPKFGKIYDKLLYINSNGIKLLKQKGISFRLLGLSRELPSSSQIQLQTAYFKKPRKKLVSKHAITNKLKPRKLHNKKA